MSKAREVLLKSGTPAFCLVVLPIGANSLVNITESDGSIDTEVVKAAEWSDVQFEVALDSGSQDHVCDLVDCPGYSLEATPASHRGSCFIVCIGARLPNQGQAILNLEPEADGSTALRSCFQIAKVTRPLMSVGRSCDNNMRVVFDDTKAVVVDGAQGCVFKRKPGGLCTCNMRLKSPFGGKPG